MKYPDLTFSSHTGGNVYTVEVIKLTKALQEIAEKNLKVKQIQEIPRSPAQASATHVLIIVE